MPPGPGRGFRSGRGRGRGVHWGGGDSRLKGQIINGVWHCDCDPKKPAVHFETKKEGPNKGRWFYSCQDKYAAGGCKFFLWEDEAKPREEAAVLNNSRTEPRPNEHIESRQPLIKPEPKGPPPSYSTLDQPSSSSTVHFNPDDFDVIPFEEHGESSRMAAVSPPRINREVPTTPGKRKYSDINETGLMTPQTGGKSAPRDNPFGERSDPAPKRVAFDPGFLDLVSPASTPTPVRFRNAEDNAAADGLFNDIKNSLRTHGVDLSEAATTAVGQVCNRHQLRTQGIANGRDVTRLALKAKDAKIAELQHRVQTLEAELATERAIVQHLRWEQEGESE